MPFYEYECTNCKFYVEALQKISDEPLRQCPSCKKQALKKLVSAPVFRLKGGGWYETDFKSDGEDKRNLADREEAAEAKEDKAETKAEDGKKETGKEAEAKPAEAKPAAGKAAAKPAKAAPKKPAAKGKPAPKPARAKAKPKPVAKKKAKRR